MTPESEPEKRSVKIGDINALRFVFENDPLAGANAQLAQSYFFTRPPKGTTPALRLNIARLQLLEGNHWEIKISDANTPLKDAMLRVGSVYGSVNLQPENDFIGEIRQLVTKIDAECSASDPRAVKIGAQRQEAHAEIHRCINCGQEAPSGEKYCGRRNCESVAAKIY